VFIVGPSIADETRRQCFGIRSGRELSKVYEDIDQRKVAASLQLRKVGLAGQVFLHSFEICTRNRVFCPGTLTSIINSTPSIINVLRKLMSSSQAARVVRHHVPRIRPAVVNANACPNCLDASRKFHSLRPDQRLLLSVVQQPSAHRSCGPSEGLVLNRRHFHGSSNSQV
jgi:hypothetical protein